MKTKLTFVKYLNRKLYSKDNSKYVTMIDILEEWKDGNHVEVIDNRTKEDITEDVLKRAIFHSVDLKLEDLRKLM